MTRVLLLLLPLFCPQVLAAQGARERLNLHVSGQGASRRVDLWASGVALNRVLARLGAALSPPVSYSVHPSLLKMLGKRRLSIRLQGVLLQDLLRWIGVAADFDLKLDEQGRFLAAVPLPAGKKPVRPPLSGTGYKPLPKAEYLRKLALKSLSHALLLPGLEEGAEVLWKLGMLHLRAGEWRQARERLAQFAREAKRGDTRVARALYLGAACALKGEQRVIGLESAKKLLQRVPELAGQNQDSPDVMRAFLLMARILMQQAALKRAHPDPGADAKKRQAAIDHLLLEARLRLNRVIFKAGDTRLEGLAILLKTELYYKLGEWSEALRTLQRFDRDRQRLYPDLAHLLPFIRGICLYKKGERQRSLLSLMTAYERDPDRRRQVRAGLYLGAAYLALKNPVQALAVVDSALTKAGSSWPVYRQRLLFLKARVECAWEARGLAIKTLVELVSSINPKMSPGINVSRALSLLGDLLFKERRFKEARSLFQRLGQVSGLEDLGLLMASRCSFQLGQYQQALKTLDRLSGMKPPKETGLLVRKLRARVYTRLGEYGKAAWSLTGWREQP